MIHYSVLCICSLFSLLWYVLHNKSSGTCLFLMILQNPADSVRRWRRIDRRQSIEKRQLITNNIILEWRGGLFCTPWTNTSCAPLNILILDIFDLQTIYFLKAYHRDWRQLITNNIIHLGWRAIKLSYSGLQTIWHNTQIFKSEVIVFFLQLF